MNISIPKPHSAGIILSYKCTTVCKHCMYNCSPHWGGYWIAENDLDLLMRQIAPFIQEAPFGPGSVHLNYGIHFTGGEPFLNFPLLLQAVEMAKKRNIPSIFVETNCSWAVSDDQTYEQLERLKRIGMDGILISVNPFYLEHIPFERTERVVAASSELFGQNMMMYQQAYYRKFKHMGQKGRLSLEEYLNTESELEFGKNVEFFLTGRAPYAMEPYGIFPQYSADFYFTQKCAPTFVRGLHNHFDNYGNYIPGYCGGLTFGDYRCLDELLAEGIDPKEYPILAFIVENNFQHLFLFAESYGYAEREEGYLSKCHLCLDIRLFLIQQHPFKELKPEEFYDRLFDYR